MNWLKTLVLFFCLAAVHLAAFDRSIMPSAGPQPTIQLGDLQSFQLENGLKVYVVENHKIPTVYASLSLDNVPDYEGKLKGVSSLTSALLGNSTQNMTKQDLHQELDFMGASLSVSTNGGYVSSLTRFFPRVLELLAESLFAPRFEEIEFNDEKHKLLDSIKSNQKNISVIANRVKNKLSYGKKHPFGEFLTEKTVATVTLNDVKSYYQNSVVPNNAYLVIVGDVDFNDIKQQVTTLFLSWKRGVEPSKKLPKVKNIKQTQIILVDMPTAVQTELYITQSSNFTMANPDYFPMMLANHILGGSSTARLFMNLREDKGYTYGSYSKLSANRYKALFSASASVRNEVTAAALTEMINEIHTIVETYVTEDELAAAKEKFIGRFIMSTEKPSTVARFALTIQKEQLPENFFETYIQQVERVTIADIAQVIKKYIITQQLRVFVTGKKEEIYPLLKQLPYSIVEVDTFGNKVKTLK